MTETPTTPSSGAGERAAYRGALEAIDRIVNREKEADEVLREAVEVLHDRFEHYS